MSAPATEKDATVEIRLTVPAEFHRVIQATAAAEGTTERGLILRALVLELDMDIDEDPALARSLGLEEVTSIASGKALALQERLQAIAGVPA